MGISEGDARGIAILRAQARRRRRQADQIEAVVAADPSTVDLFPTSAADLREQATLGELAADQEFVQAKARQALREAHLSRRDAAVFDAIAALQAGTGTVDGVVAAGRGKLEKISPVEHAAYRAAEVEAVETRRLWREIHQAVGRNTRVPGIEDNVDDSPDPAEVARLVAGEE